MAKKTPAALKRFRFKKGGGRVGAKKTSRRKRK